MDNAMVKRGIGAVVLAIIAALLLGYLLKDKSRERRDVVEMNLPGTADTKIPSLSDSVDNATASVTDGVSDVATKASETGDTVVAAVTGSGTAVTEKVSDAVDTVKDTAAQVAAPAIDATRPGFSIRPAGDNEQREIVGKNASKTNAQTGGSKTASTKTSRPESNNTKGKSAKSGDKVVASASGGSKDSYRPRLIKERKKVRIVSSSDGSRKSASSTKSSNKDTVVAKKGGKSRSKPVARASAKTGDYAIQLMATSSKSRAKKLANTMKGEGYRSYITKTSRSNKVLYRVRVRAGKSRNTALAAQKKMKRRYQKNFFVQNSLVVSN